MKMSINAVFCTPHLTIQSLHLGIFLFTAADIFIPTPVSHLDHIEAPDPKGLDLLAYKSYVPLYIVADFLGLDDLCRDLIGRLHRTNKRIAAVLQRHAAEGSVGGATVLPDSFKTDFAECARLAYSIPARITDDDIAGWLPGGIRNTFVELFEFVRYAPLDPVLPSLAAHAPKLLVDLMMSIRVVEGAGLRFCRHSTCEDCGIDPISGSGKKLEQGQSQLSVGQSGFNFWVRDDLCFECSVYYPREELLFNSGPSVGQEESNA